MITTDTRAQTVAVDDARVTTLECGVSAGCSWSTTDVPVLATAAQHAHERRCGARMRVRDVEASPAWRIRYDVRDTAGNHE